ncbi:hypothetical protein [Amycolatopsis thermoflava]|uniref:hypothetical protein n=1 Tax=Amycolatopsis thermoflava TaxID=84480 RepID=UPI003D74EF78
MTVAMVEKRQRKARSDAGQVRQTARDALVLHWLCQMYGAPLDLIQEALQIGRPRAYQLADRWKRAGWIDKAVVDGHRRGSTPGPTAESVYLTHTRVWVRYTSPAHGKQLFDVPRCGR